MVFEPAYNVFIVTYFSENPGDTREVVRAYNAFFRDPRTPPMFWEPPDGCEAWWDLRQTEVLLDVHYPPGERTLGVTGKHDEAHQWVADANQFLNAIKALRRVDFLHMLRSEDEH